MNPNNGGGFSGMPQGDAELEKNPARHDYHKTITMADIAKLAGVSQGAISSLLNDRDYGIRVSEKTRDRVFKACRELGYIPNDLRAVVRMYPERGETVVLASNEIGDGLNDPVFARLLNGVMAATEDPSHAVVVARFDAKADYMELPDKAPLPVRAGTASKFICLGKPNLSLFHTILRRGFPVISVGHDVVLDGVSSILPDSAEASRLAVEYLFKLGHEHIAILSGPFGSIDQEIIELNRGVRTAYDAAQIPIEAQNIIYGDLTFQNGFRAAEVLLKRTPVPTAILCLNDNAATGALALLQSRGLKVPEEISVLGCSDDAFANYVFPPLTTIHVPAEEIGAAAVAEIERRVLAKEEGLLHAKKIVLPVRLVERQSCAAPQSRAEAATLIQA